MYSLRRFYKVMFVLTALVVAIIVCQTHILSFQGTWRQTQQQRVCEYSCYNSVLFLQDPHSEF